MLHLTMTIRFASGGSAAPASGSAGIGNLGGPAGGGGGSQFGSGEAAWNQQVEEGKKAAKTPDTANTTDPTMPYFYSPLGNLLPNPSYDPNYHPEGPRSITADFGTAKQGPGSR